MGTYSHAPAAHSEAGFIAGQLNSTQLDVELSCVVRVFIAAPTQLNVAYTVHQRSKIISERRDPVESICRALHKL